MTPQPVEPVRLVDDARAVRIIDQRRLPQEFVERDLTTVNDVVEAIATLAVRGAPAIGVCAAAGLAVALRGRANGSRDSFLAALDDAAETVANARPTAANLRWAVERVRTRARNTAGEGTALAAALLDEARRLQDEDLAMGRAIGAHGLTLFGDPVQVLTHCNTGALATAGAGTALAIVYAAHAAGRRVTVYATETRPLFQGARLTAWELHRAGVAVTVITDGSAAALLQRGGIQAVLVGADRIAANGDVANKIGTYALAIQAAYHGVPFYVCAPWSTIDPSTATGDAIPIEMRGRDELAQWGAAAILPDGVPAWTPAFDVTPASLVSAIVTDRAVHRPPYNFGSR